MLVYFIKLFKVFSRFLIFYQKFQSNHPGQMSFS